MRQETDCRVIANCNGAWSISIDQSHNRLLAQLILICLRPPVTRYRWLCENGLMDRTGFFFESRRHDLGLSYMLWYKSQGSLISLSHCSDTSSAILSRRSIKLDIFDSVYSKVSRMSVQKRLRKMARKQYKKLNHCSDSRSYSVRRTV